MEAAVQVNLRRLLAEKEVRENIRFSVMDVARATGLSRQSVYKWLSGEVKTIRLDTLAQMCRFLDCQPGDMLTLEPIGQANVEIELA